MGFFTCRRLCLKFAVNRGTNPFKEGLKRCRHCNIWTDDKGTRCPCCRIKYRTHPRDSYQRKLTVLVAKRY